MRFALPVFHVTERFGRNEQGIMKPKNLVESVAKVAKMGVSAVGLALNSPEFYSSSQSQEVKEKLLCLKEKKELTYSAHQSWQPTLLAVYSSKEKRFYFICF